ncbi:Protein PCF11 [Cyberlindnera fabianii]|uniref:Protein PCF11 n=1 Tax=Cyberlindnera fabianii TaxID=36022 RepID=A0A1V2L4V5_CYBFA|nr:Protein PCF11 [Cyberlindnera fabianii]
MDPDQDLEQIGEDFAVSLQDLTFNSKPIITTLTMIAQENINAAEQITTAVEQRIDKAIPTHKLFAIYLLDSICKNVGSPYSLLFGQKLFQTFTRAYLLVDDPTRKKLIDLFRTWKTARTSSGLPVFPDEPINKIEQFLIKASTLYQQQFSSTPQQQHFTPPPQQHQPQQQQILVNSQTLIPIIDRLLYLTEQRRNLTPGDDKILQKLQIINQLKIAIQAEQLDPQSLAGAKTQLDEMTRQEEHLLRNTPPIKSPALAQPVPNLNNLLQSANAPPPQPYPQQQQQQTAPAPIPASAPLPTSKTAPPIPQGNLLGMGNLGNLINLRPGSTPTPPVQASVSAPPAKPTPPANLASILSTLSQKGVIKPKTASPKPSIPNMSLLGSILQKTSTPTSQPQTATPTPPPQTSIDTSNSNTSLSSYFSQFEITAKFLTLDPSATFTTLFITDRPNKCGTCGKRFTNTATGQVKYRSHLDWHFRVNKKLRDGSGASSRNWFLDDEEFVAFRDDEVIGATDDGVKEVKKVKKERKYVVVPSDESSEMSCVCGICKEVMKAKFDDDLGEWIWDGAVMNNGKVFHQTCFEEAQGLDMKRVRDEKPGVDFNLLSNILNNGKRVKSESN